jgi:hypothetical protein
VQTGDARMVNLNVHAIRAKMRVASKRPISVCRPQDVVGWSEYRSAEIGRRLDPNVVEDGTGARERSPKRLFVSVALCDNHGSCRILGGNARRSL